MVEKEEFPIIEFDNDSKSILNPEIFMRTREYEQEYPKKIPEKAVLTFFNDVLDDIHNRKESEIFGYLHSEIGKNPIYRITIEGTAVLVLHPGVGAPLAAAFLEEMIALGTKKVIVCGSCGTLNKELSAGRILVPYSAIRDEGTSYHYVPPGREIGPTKSALDAVKSTLQQNRIPYAEVKTWTTDAFYRETPNKVKMRKDEGCTAVDMEASALFAVAKFRKIELAEILYAGDSLDGISWDPRHFDEKMNVREKLFWLSVQACTRL